MSKIIVDENIPSRRVLVVDDEENTRFAFRMLLQKAGYAVQTAAHGLEALTSLHTQVSDLVLTDLQMPYMNGIDLLRTLRRDFPGLPVVMMTAFKGADTEAMVHSHGAVEILFKPVDPDHLRSVLERCIGV